MYEIYKFLHGIGILMTVGVITASLIYGWYKKLFPNNKLLTKIQFPYKWISPSVKIGLVVLIISGLGMYAERAEQFNSSAVFWIKMGFVLALVINNIWLNSILKPKGKKIYEEYFYEEGKYVYYPYLIPHKMKLYTAMQYEY